MKHTSIIDANSVGRAAHSGAKLKAAGMETQAAFNFIRGLVDLKRTTPHTVPLVLWDNRADWRYALHPDYKSNRENDPQKVAEAESYKKMRPYIGRMLQHLGVRQVSATGYEADDLAGFFVERMRKDQNMEVELVTGDRDWLQLVGGNVSWRDHRNDAIVNSENFYVKTGCKTPFAFLETKILTGDTSDCISGVGGLGEKGAPEFIAEFGSMRNFWMMCAKGDHVPKGKTQQRLLGACPLTLEEWMRDYPGDPDDAKAVKKFADTWPGQGRVLYKRNFQLMQLLRVTPPSKASIQIIPGAFDKQGFAQVCEELAFTSILRSLDGFVKPFQN